MIVAERVLQILTAIAETNEVREDPELRLFDLDVLDSLRAVELMVALSEEFGIEISPAEFEREEWATPRRIIAYMQRRLAG